jgi:GH24 family phage-related lysozyme (muramidase)
MKKLLLVILLWTVSQTAFTFTKESQVLLCPNINEIEQATTQDSLTELMLFSLKHFEGFIEKTKWDFKQYTNGWGTKGKKDEIITIEEADKRFEENLDKYFCKIAEEYPHLKEGQLVATVMLSYNVGPNAIIKSNITDNLLDKGVKPPFEKWNKAGGNVLSHLIQRRTFESQVWDNWREIYNNQFNNLKVSVNGIYQSQANAKASV